MSIHLSSTDSGQLMPTVSYLIRIIIDYYRTPTGLQEL
jgi:hypothetical protein